MSSAADKTDTGYLETEDIETASDGYASRFAGEVGQYFLEVQKELTLDLLRPLNVRTVLDVGGGHAQLAVPLVREGFDVTVTGSDDACRARLDRLLPQESFSYRTCDLLNHPFPDRSFDVVLAFRLLPHVRDWPHLIGEMCRMARLAVIVDYPDIRSFNFLTSRLFGLKKAIEGNTRTYTLFSRKQVVGEFARNAFVNPAMRPEFFLPMVLHRKMGSASFSKGAEQICRVCGLTGLFGSPIIARFLREGE